MASLVTAVAAAARGCHAFLAPPSVRELLATRSIVGTAAERCIWQGGVVADKPALVSGNVPAARDFAHTWLLMWGRGVQIEINPYAGYPRRCGGHARRLLCRCRGDASLGVSRFYRRYMIFARGSISRPHRARRARRALSCGARRIMRAERVAPTSALRSRRAYDFLLAHAKSGSARFSSAR